MTKFTLHSIAALYLVVVCNVCFAQYPLNYFHTSSENTSFPDSARMNGHVYNGVVYSTKDHYSDNSLLIITPKNFHPNAKVDLVFWFHGWNNNIDSALVSYGLSRQFAGSGVNAVLVLAETTKNAPDSYGGKLEKPDQFRKLVNDVLKKLYVEKILRRNCTAGKVILAGHSGAYRIMAGILQNGNVPVNEVILFDALYAETDKFIKWLMADNDHRFINLYTNHGGTRDESLEMLKRLTDLKLPAYSIEEAVLTPQIVAENKILFIHTEHEHNDIIQRPDNFGLFLDGSPFLKKLQSGNFVK